MPFCAYVAASVCSSALAASFDCGKATSPRERVICGSGVLSELDGQLGRVYAARRALLSADGRALLQISERNWLGYVATVCPLSAPGQAGVRRKAEDCLQGRYQERLAQLTEVGRRMGPFVFNRVDLFAAEPAADDGGQVAGFDVQHLSYPQIDAPMSAAARAWNTQNARSLGKGDDCGQGDEDTSYVLGLANARLISVQWTEYLYCHGTPHGMFGVKTQNIVLSPSFRQMTVQDMFGPDDGWMVHVQALFWDALRKKGWRPPANTVALSKSEIDSAVVRLDRWMFAPDGVSVGFSAYEGGCYACTPPEVTVSYGDLRPYLLATAPVP